MKCSCEHGTRIRHNAYWVTFSDRPAASVWTETEETARTIAERHGTVAKIEILPYPAEPRLDDPTHSMPSFCWQPTSCAGKTSCPRDFPCVD